MIGNKRFKWISSSGIKASDNRKGLLYSISRTKVEVGFVAILVVLGIAALLQLNIAGGIWLIWFGGMYSLATVFFYKYG